MQPLADKSHLRPEGMGPLPLQQHLALQLCNEPALLLLVLLGGAPV